MAHKFVAHEVYAEQLGKLCKGFPLWFPEPLPKEDPIELGDVGLLLNGEFKRLFNAVRAPRSGEIYPEDFEFLTYQSRLESEHDLFLDRGPVTNANVKYSQIGMQAGV